MNKDDYQHKINYLLDDPTTYLKITDKRTNPTSKVEKYMNSLLREIRSQPATHNQETKQIQDKLYYFLHSTDANVVTFYGLPKIHKPEIPLRPITSCIGFPTYRLSKHLVRILSPLLNENFSIKNSNEFAEQIRLQSISSNEIMVSFNVVSLFTSIPIELALQVVKQRLVQDNNLTTRTDISINNIIKLLEFVLRNSFFKYDGCHYQQISGCAMGSPISATLANIVMEHIEEIAITTAPHPARWWFRFVDDSHTCLLKDYVSEFHDHLYKLHQS
jgi:hypothetical protein